MLKKIWREQYLYILVILALTWLSMRVMTRDWKEGPKNFSDFATVPGSQQERRWYTFLPPFFPQSTMLLLLDFLSYRFCFLQLCGYCSFERKRILLYQYLNPTWAQDSEGDSKRCQIKQTAQYAGLAWAKGQSSAHTNFNFWNLSFSVTLNYTSYSSLGKFNYLSIIWTQIWHYLNADKHKKNRLYLSML